MPEDIPYDVEFNIDGEKGPVIRLQRIPLARFACVADARHEITRRTGWANFIFAARASPDGIEFWLDDQDLLGDVVHDKESEQILSSARVNRC